MNKYEKLKALYFDSTEINKDDIIWGLLELGADVRRSTLRIVLDYRSDEMIDALVNEVDGYDFVITQNFSVNVAETCHIRSIPYISWVYDSPQKSLYRKEAAYDTNYIFAFDKKQVERIKNIGVSNIYHMPLAANIAQASSVNITDEDIGKYSCDLSFVGSVYKKDFFDETYNELEDRFRNELDEIINSKLCKWGTGISVYDKMSDDFVEYIHKRMNTDGLDEYKMAVRYLLETIVIAPEIAGRERIRIMNTASKICDAHFYTNNPEKHNNEIKAVLHPPVAYGEELYKVYYASKINLNLTLPSIETGIPQRVYDIMSVGGPVFSNYQEEMTELFVPDKEIVLFSSEDEFREKVKYYLAHENERIRLGINGYLRVRDEYNYPNLLMRMLEKVFS